MHGSEKISKFNNRVTIIRNSVLALFLRRIWVPVLTITCEISLVMIVPLEQCLYIKIRDVLLTVQMCCNSYTDIRKPGC